MRDMIEREGLLAYRPDKSYDNPYAHNSDEFNRYERGWMQALKKSSHVSMQDTPGKRFSVKPVEPEPVYKPPYKPDLADKYRNRKG